MSEGDGMVTEADREKALEVADSGRRCGVQLFEAIAAALAEERQKARVPFLAVAESCERATEVEGISNERSTAYSIAAARIRRAAEETP